MRKIYNQKLADTPRDLLTRIHERVEITADGHALAPMQFYVANHGTFSTRTVLYFLTHDEAPRYIHPMCGVANCVNPLHMRGSNSQHAPLEILPLSTTREAVAPHEIVSTPVQIPAHLLTRKQQDEMIAAALRAK